MAYGINQVSAQLSEDELQAFLPDSESLTKIAELLQQCSYDLDTSPSSLVGAIINLLTQPVYIFNSEGVLEYVNQPGARSLDRTTEEVIGKTIFQIMDDEVAQRRWEYISTMLKDKEAFAFIDFRQGRHFVNRVYCLQRERGHFRRLLVSILEITDTVILAETLKNTNRELERQIAERTEELRKVNWELTEVIAQKQIAEEALRERERQYRTLIEASPFGILQVQLNGDIVLLNQQSLTILGYNDPEELRNKHISEIISSFNQADFIRQLLEGKFSNINRDILLIRKDGSLLPVRVGVSLLAGADDKTNSFIFVFFDISAQYFAEQRIRANLRMSEALATAATQASAASNLTEALNAICEQACQTLNAPVAVIRLYNSDNQMLEIAGSNGLPQEYLKTYSAIHRDPLLNLTDIQSERVRLNILDEAPPTPADVLPFRSQLQYSLTCNMIRKNEFIGVTVVLIPKGHPPIGDEEKMFLQALAEQASICVERFRLAEQQITNANKLETMVRSFIDLRKAQTKKEIAYELLQGVRKVLNPDKGLVYLILNDQMVLVDSFDIPDNVPRQQGIEQDCPILSALQQGQILFLENINERSELLNCSCFSSILINEKSAIILPLQTAQQIEGFMALAYPEVKKFDNDSRHIAFLYKELAESVLNRINIFEHLEKSVDDRTHELKMLYEVTSYLNNPLSLHETLHSALERILEFTNARAVAIHAYQTDKKQLKLMANTPIDEGGLLEYIRGNLSRSCVWERVLEVDGTLQLDDISTYIEHKKASISLPASYFGVPIRSRGQTLGTLSIFSNDNQPLLRDHHIILSAIADQLGMAIERANLIEQAEEAAKLEERQRLARDLHDALNQSLYSLTLLTKAYQRSIYEASPDEIHQWLKEINEISLEAMKELRLLLYELRPTAIEQDGLQGALRRRLEAVEHRAMIETNLSVQGSYRLPPHEEEQIYRIAQEALNNALQHARHKKVDVNIISTKDYFEMNIVDDGIGFDVAQTVKSTQGMGLANMLNRAEQLGAHLSIYSRPFHGTLINLSKKRSHHD